MHAVAGAAPDVAVLVAANAVGVARLAGDIETSAFDPFRTLNPSGEGLRRVAWVS
jgi:hypothetical protein